MASTSPIREDVQTLKIGVSGVRGIVGQSLTPQLVVGFAEAFAVMKEGGWNGLDLPEAYGGQGLPYLLVLGDRRGRVPDADDATRGG